MPAKSRNRDRSASPARTAGSKLSRHERIEAAKIALEKIEAEAESETESSSDESVDALSPPPYTAKTCKTVKHSKPSSRSRGRGKKADDSDSEEWSEEDKLAAINAKTRLPKDSSKSFGYGGTKAIDLLYDVDAHYKAFEGQYAKGSFWIFAGIVIVGISHLTATWDSDNAAGYVLGGALAFYGWMVQIASKEDEKNAEKAQQGDILYFLGLSDVPPWATITDYHVHPVMQQLAAERRHQAEVKEAARQAQANRDTAVTAAVLVAGAMRENKRRR